MTIKVALCVPAYGLQSKDFWMPLVQQASQLHQNDIELTAGIAISGMMTDKARNSIAREALATEAEWLWWMDADNIYKIGMLKRMLDTGRKLVTGIYVKRGGDPEPIAYFREADGRYRTLGAHRRGEIIPLDAAGMGGLLVHRSVFEDIDKHYRVLTRSWGGEVVIHRDDIQGDIFDGVTAEDDGKVVDGVLHDRLYLPKTKVEVPFFMLEYGRTEDYGFFERAKRVGHQLWCDTSVELGHLGDVIHEPAEYHEWLRLQ